MWSHAAPCPKDVRGDFPTLWLAGKAFLFHEKTYQSKFEIFFSSFYRLSVQLLEILYCLISKTITSISRV
jgi:hypothetical protein